MFVNVVASSDPSVRSHELSATSPLSDEMQSPVDPPRTSTSSPPPMPAMPALPSFKARGKQKAAVPKDVE